MEFDQHIKQMATQAETIAQIVQGVGDEQARWKPDADSWSILEVINHLFDEERLDFRVRLDHILHKPGIDPPAIDPPGWVTERAYNKRQLQPSLDDFLMERESSLVWLKHLEAPNWEATYRAPWGTIRAGDMFVAWVAHDLLHIRQLIELHYAWTTQLAQPYEVAYAGDW
jgi:hypothetical protein